MFSFRLTRLPYAILMYAHSFWMMGYISGRDPLHWWPVYLSLPVLFVLVIWPRLRDCDWPVWFGFLLAVPVLGSLLGLSLLFAPSKVFGRREHAHEAAGSSCARCGTLISGLEGAGQGDEVLCESCRKAAGPASPEP